VNTPPPMDLQAPPEPKTLGELLDRVMDTRGYHSLAELARHTSVPDKTLYAWRSGTRNRKRAPRRSQLHAFAEDLNWPEGMVFRAAGLTYDEPAVDPEALEISHLWRQLSPAEKRMTERLMRDLIEGRRPPAAGPAKGEPGTGR